MAGLETLSSNSELQSFLSSHTNAIVTFSAHWCGPCKKSKPQLEQLALAITSDPNYHVAFAIVYENDLQEQIHSYNIRAFPTYVLYKHQQEQQRVEGANIPAIQQMAQSCTITTQPLGTGETLGGGKVHNPQSLEEARKARLEALANAGINTDQPPAPSGDVEMKDANTAEAETTITPPPPDPTVNLDPELVRQLTEEMGFTLIRAQKGLLYGNAGTLEGAIDWLTNHQDDPDIDDPIPAEKPMSYKCNECGKILSNMANLELHANKTGHSDFEESTERVKPLTEEEKAAKIAEIKQLLKLKRAEREEAEKVDETEREKQRRMMGKEMAKTKEELDKEQRKREAYLRKKEKEEFKKERARIRAELDKDRMERAANKGKLTSKLGVEGYNPSAIQYNVDAEGGEEAVHHKKKPKADAAKIDEYIQKVSSYRAGGDGGKCLKLLSLFVGNVVDHPEEEKYRSINMLGNAYKTKVKPLLGAKNLLLAVGFSPSEDESSLVLREDADHNLLAETKQKLLDALTAYGS